ncbi:hypothetical protein [Haloferula rosea]|uniref:DUF2304 domain-containing protein n=1 Tax=Haloferula rosea TaxID=490093 RepID=A0A934RD22_9BACT|nr:hypothetical protein [Haloferula rosea]MBK1828952.1 hypothetical protein [Haloferula rosea]
MLLAFLVPAWVGAVALRKARPSSGAKVLFIGCVVSTVGIVLTLLLVVAGFAMGMNGPGLQIAALVSYLTIPVGMLVFMVGFALHGLQSARVVDRITELETIAAAQQEQISRLEAQG